MKPIQLLFSFAHCKFLGGNSKKILLSQKKNAIREVCRCIEKRQLSHFKHKMLYFEAEWVGNQVALWFWHKERLAVVPKPLQTTWVAKTSISRIYWVETLGYMVLLTCGVLKCGWLDKPSTHLKQSCPRPFYISIWTN